MVTPNKEAKAMRFKSTRSTKSLRIRLLTIQKIALAPATRKKIIALGSR